jgi:hypothetical protein
MATPDTAWRNSASTSSKSIDSSLAGEASARLSSSKGMSGLAVPLAGTGATKRGALELGGAPNAADKLPAMVLESTPLPQLVRRVFHEVEPLGTP